MLRIRSRRARSSRSTLIVGQHVRRHISSVAETSQRNAAVAADLDPSDRTVVQTDAQPRVRWKLKRAQNGVPNDVTVTDDDFVLWRRRLRRRRRRRRRSVERLAKSSLDSRSVRDVHVLSLSSKCPVLDARARPRESIRSIYASRSETPLLL